MSSDDGFIVDDPRRLKKLAKKQKLKHKRLEDVPARFKGKGMVVFVNGFWKSYFPNIFWIGNVLKMNFSLIKTVYCKNGFSYEKITAEEVGKRTKKQGKIVLLVSNVYIFMLF
jgi:hypothetical protein